MDCNGNGQIKTKIQSDYLFIFKSKTLILYLFDECTCTHLLFIQLLGDKFHHSLITFLSSLTGRGKYWSRQLANFQQTYASDAFFLNLGCVLLRFCSPFTNPQNDSILSVDLSYCRVQLGADPSEEHMAAKGVHLKGMFGAHHHL